jgi:hypothetical protein
LERQTNGGPDAAPARTLLERLAEQCDGGLEALDAALGPARSAGITVI